jgi:Flp pilus assembly protein TadG
MNYELGNPKSGFRLHNSDFKSPLGRLVGDTEGSALLETVIVLPVLMLFMMLVMESCLLANAKQLANYAAFCAARTASVYGVDSTAKTHLAAAMAMSPISPATPPNALAILSAYGLPNPSQAVHTVCSTPGLQDSLQWSARLADSYVRTSQPICSTGTTQGKTRKHVVVNVTYIYRCSTFPFGKFWGHTGLTAYTNTLRALPFYGVISAVVTSLDDAWSWNVPIHGRAVMDYWAGS